MISYGQLAVRTKLYRRASHGVLLWVQWILVLWVLRAFFLEDARLPLKPTVEYVHVPMLGTADLALLVLTLTAMLPPLQQSQLLNQVRATPLTMLHLFSATCSCLVWIMPDKMLLAVHLL